MANFSNKAKQVRKTIFDQQFIESFNRISELADEIAWDNQVIECNYNRFLHNSFLATVYEWIERFSFRCTTFSWNLVLVVYDCESIVLDITKVRANPVTALNQLKVIAETVTTLILYRLYIWFEEFDNEWN